MKTQHIIRKIIPPFKRFFALKASAGIALLFVAVLAMIWANSPWTNIYEKILHYPINFQLGTIALSFTLHHFVNDVLMVIFFFVVGLEIKKEITLGELSTLKKATLPIVAALGGMIVPALIYLIFNINLPSRSGWGIPMATDIAFAIGILNLIPHKTPFSLKIFLLALAIVDDLGAILVIAFFYSQNISGSYLAFSGGLIFFIFFAQKIGIKHILFYILCGILLWFFIFKSGVHATIAGVLLGLMCPSKRVLDQQDKTKKIQSFSKNSYKHTKSTINLLRALHTPTHRLIEELQPYVNWLIMPLFAFFNAGINFESDFSFSEFSRHPISLGIFFGLLLGKPLGILFFSFLSVRLKLAHWPPQFTIAKVIGVGFLAGIGFTMALFIAHLSFEDQAQWAMYSKLSIVLSSVIAMVLGLIFLIFSHKDPIESEEKNR